MQKLEVFFFFFKCLCTFLKKCCYSWEQNFCLFHQVQDKITTDKGMSSTRRGWIPVFSGSHKAATSCSDYFANVKNKMSLGRN